MQTRNFVLNVVFLKYIFLNYINNEEKAKFYLKTKKTKHTCRLWTRKIQTKIFHFIHLNTVKRLRETIYYRTRKFIHNLFYLKFRTTWCYQGKILIALKRLETFIEYFFAIMQIKKKPHLNSGCGKSNVGIHACTFRISLMYTQAFQ